VLAALRQALAERHAGLADLDFAVRSLITGVGGFAGQHLAAHLLRRGESVYGVARRDVEWHIPTVPDDERFSLIEADLMSASDAQHLVEAAQPERIYHLAGQSSVPQSFADPADALQSNAAPTVNVLEAMRTVAPRARMLVVSSSEIYGRATSGAPLDEYAEFRPESPYAVSKATQDLFGYQYHVAFGLDIVRVRPFNFIGPGQSDRFVTASFAKQIAEIEAGQREPVLSVGNLEARRDFTDVRDMVAAFELALSRGEAGAAYNVGSGVAVQIQTLLDSLLSRSTTPVSVHIDQGRMRRVDPPVSICDATSFRKRTGWEPRLALGTTLEDTLRYWRNRMKAT
jgi:GDP-4-dehydro-6-deoxy-D-mannose reductase